MCLQELKQVRFSLAAGGDYLCSLLVLLLVILSFFELRSNVIKGFLDGPCLSQLEVS